MEKFLYFYIALITLNIYSSDILENKTANFLSEAIVVLNTDYDFYSKDIYALEKIILSNNKCLMLLSNAIKDKSKINFSIGEDIFIPNEKEIKILANLGNFTRLLMANFRFNILSKNKKEAYRSLMNSLMLCSKIIDDKVLINQLLGVSILKIIDKNMLSIQNDFFCNLNKNEKKSIIDFIDNLKMKYEINFKKSFEYESNLRDIDIANFLKKNIKNRREKIHLLALSYKEIYSFLAKNWGDWNIINSNFILKVESFNTKFKYKEIDILALKKNYQKGLYYLSNLKKRIKGK